MEKLGQDVSEFRKEKAPDPERSFFRLQRSTFTLDFLPTVPGLRRFRPVFNARETAQLGNVEITFIGFEDLIINKKALGRPKDEEDIRQLQIKRNERKQSPHGKRKRSR